MPYTSEEIIENPILSLGVHRTSVFDDVKLPAYRRQTNIFCDYSFGRPSPIWKVSEAARRAVGKERLEKLAMPRKMHPEYLPARPPIASITKAAMEAVPSGRITELAKARPHFVIIENEWRVKPSALHCTPSERILELSQPRQLPSGYLSCKSAREIWKVSPNACKATPSDRIEKLSKPLVRSVATNLPRQDAFLVSEAAKRAVASKRIAELARPIERLVLEKQGK